MPTDTPTAPDGQTAKETAMQHAREDYQDIQHTGDTRALAEAVYNMTLLTSAGQNAKRLAMKVLGITDPFQRQDEVCINTNGTTRFIPVDEPVFLIRGQDAVSGEAVRAWADLAEARGAASDITRVARDHAAKMDAWPKKKVPDLSPGDVFDRKASS